MTAPHPYRDEAAARAAWRAWADGLQLAGDPAGPLVLLGDLALWLTDTTEGERPAAVQRLADALERAAPPLFIAQPGAPAAPADGAAFGYWTPAALAAARADARHLAPAVRRKALGYYDRARAVAPGLPAVLQLLRTEWAAYGHSLTPPPAAAVFAWGALPGRGLALRAADVPALGLPVGSVTINAAGLAEIAAFLGRCHRLGREHFTPAMLRAWAADAEFQLSEGNTPTIEIKSWDALSGHTEAHTVSAAGLSWEPPAA